MAAKIIHLSLVLAVLASPVLGQVSQTKPFQADQSKQWAPDHFATCQEATEKVPGYSLVREALQRCPDLQALQLNPNAEMTYFVPSDRAIKALASAAHLPVAVLNSNKFKSIMCNVLQYHVVSGVHLKRDWQVGQKMPTLYKGQEVTVTATGQMPKIATTTGVQANVKRVVFCGKSVVFGTDAVLTPFKVPMMGH